MICSRSKWTRTILGHCLRGAGGRYHPISLQSIRSVFQTWAPTTTLALVPLGIDRRVGGFPYLGNNIRQSCDTAG